MPAARRARGGCSRSGRRARPTRRADRRALVRCCSPTAWRHQARPRGRPALRGAGVAAAGGGVAVAAAAGVARRAVRTGLVGGVRARRHAARRRASTATTRGWTTETGSGSTSESDGTRFAWDHKYGPIDWPRDGTPAARRCAPTSRTTGRPRRSTTSTGCAGSTRTPRSARATRGARFPSRSGRRWNEEDPVHGARASERAGGRRRNAVFRGGRRVARSPRSPTARSGCSTRLREGDSYRVYAYVPDPSAARCAPRRRTTPSGSGRTPAFDLPRARPVRAAERPVTEAERARSFSRRLTTLATVRGGETLPRADERPRARRVAIRRRRTGSRAASRRASRPPTTS